MNHIKDVNLQPVIAKALIAIGGIPLTEKQRAVLQVWWPECFESMHGGVVMPKEDEALMEEMFECFGVPLKVSENSMNVISLTYRTFALEIAPFVQFFAEWPDSFRRMYPGWPEDWYQYLEAVASFDKQKARAYAKRLNVLDREIPLPDGMVRSDENENKIY